jgi:hypothetical protein
MSLRTRVLQQTLLFSSLSFLFIFSSFLSVDAETRFDLDDDDLSEILLLTIDGDKNIDWQILSSQTEYTRSMSDSSNFGEEGFAYAAGDWNGDGSIQFGHVERDPEKNKLQWTVQTVDGTETAGFGDKAEQILSGFDIDGNGYDAIAMNRKGKVSVRLNPFVESRRDSIFFNLPRQWTNRIHKGGAHPVFFSDSEGARVGMVYRKAGRVIRYRLGVNNFSDGSRARTRLNSVPKGDLIAVKEIRNSNGKAYILTVEEVARQKSRVRVFDQEGGLIFGDDYLGRNVLVGRYTSTSQGEQFGVQNGTTFTVVNPFVEDTATLTLPEGILADLITVQQLEKPAGSGGGSTGGGDNNNTGAGPGLSSVCPNVTGFTTGRLWKPDSDVSDARGGKPVLLLTGSNKTSRSRRRIWDSKGSLVCSGMTFKASSEPGVNNNADHYFAGWVGGCGLSGGQMASRARSNTGSTTVYLEWKSGTCLKIPNPDSRYGGI